MNANNQPDRLSSLGDVVLIMIISSLTFKEGVRTSILSKRWTHLCHETRTIAFKEAEYVDHSVSDNISKRDSFVRYASQWVSRFRGNVIESFELCLSNAMDYEAEIQSLIQFAVSRKVKNLVLDFSDPSWRNVGDAPRYEPIVQLPECIYGLETLESLKIFTCGFDPSRFDDLRMLRRFSVGWMSLKNLKPLISKSPMLESVSIVYCWNLDITKIAGNMKEFVLENCDFPYMACTFDLPNVDMFKYSGQVLPLHFERMNVVIKEVILDFGAEREYDVPSEGTSVDGDVLSGFINHLRAARTLTVDPHLLQTIQECDHPYYLIRPVETKHLVLKTKLQTKEFKGISLLLHNCPNLETLTIDILPPTSFPPALTYGDVDSETYWIFQNYDYLPSTLKVVVVKNFGGKTNEINVLKYLIESGRENGGPLIEKVEIYMLNVMEENERILALDGVEMLEGIANPFQVIVHNA